MSLTDTMPAREVRRESGPRVRISSAQWWIPLTAAMAFAVIASQLWIGLSLGDEGFLWYGAQRVLEGELPIRDFQAYDPGRYLWVAGWMAVLGDDSIFAMRWANAALAAITVALATWTVASGPTRPSIAGLAVASVTFTLWMVPHYKVSDSFAVTLLLFGLTRLFQRPGIERCFQGGACLGLASIIGINHALYGSIAALLALLYLRNALNPARAVPAAIAGAVVGYAPVLALHVLAPGFTAAFIDGIVQLSEYGTTNISLPFPNPLATLRAREWGLLHTPTQLLLALLFVGVPLLWIWTAWRMRRAKFRAALSPAILAGLLLSVPYAHYAYSRADLVHTAVSILPLLAAALAWALGTADPLWRWPTLAAIIGASVVMTAREQPAYHALRNDRMEALVIDGAHVLVSRNDAAEIRAVRSVATAAGSFFAGPYLPGAYALAKRRSPAWETYMLFPASSARQRAEIARLRAFNIRHALVSTRKVDGRRDLGIERTHPLVTAYLKRCLERSMAVPGSPDLTIRTADRGACPSRRSNGPSRPDRAARTAGTLESDGANRAR